MAIINERSGGKRTTLTVSITPENKKVLKQAALDRDVFVADLVHEWIEREFRGVSKDRAKGDSEMLVVTHHDAMGKGAHAGGKLKAVDLFCGCGGMSLGFGRAGYKIVAAIDNWAPALDVYRANLETPALDVDLSDAEAAAKLVEAFKPDIVIGGPPCQDFSIAGNRDETGGRASLTLSFADIVCHVRPKCFVMENVYTAPKSKTYTEAFRRFRDTGYGITAEVLDASRCGVPQARKRAFIVGILDESDDALANGLKAGLSERQMTVRDYLGDALGTEYYFSMPRSYDRRGIFSIDEPAVTVRGMNRPLPETYKKHPRDAANPSEARVLTEEERGWLQTFPKGFEWSGSKSDVNQMIGNAVPVNMARYVAEVLKSHLQGTDVNGNLSASTFENDAII